MIEIVNIVAGGDLDRELNIEAVKNALDPEVHEIYVSSNGLQVKIFRKSPNIAVYRTGKYIITGANTREELDTIHEAFLRLMKKFDILEVEPTYKIYNIVFKGDLNHQIDLMGTFENNISQSFEYEPEQSPFLIYRPDSVDCTVTIANSGKIVISGASSEEDANMAYDETKKVITKQ